MSANTLADSCPWTHTIQPHTCCRPGWPDQLQGVTVLRYLESSRNSERSDLTHRSYSVRDSSFVTSPERKFNPASASLNPSPAVWKCSKAQLFFQNGNIPFVKNQLWTFVADYDEDHQRTTSLSVVTTMMQQVQSKICIIQPTQAAAISFSCSTPTCTQAKQNVVCCCSRKAAAHWWLAQLGRNASAYCHSTVITNNHYCETRVHTHPFWTTSKMWYHSTHHIRFLEILTTSRN